MEDADCWSENNQVFVARNPAHWIEATNDRRRRVADSRPKPYTRAQIPDAAARRVAS